MEDYISKFKRCIYEYTSLGTNIEEDDPNAQMAAAPSDQNAMGGAMMAADPNAMGGAVDMNGDGLPDDPNAMMADPNAQMAAQQPVPAQPTGAEGFQPQGETEPQVEDKPEQTDNTEEMNNIKDSQEDVEKKIDSLTNKFDELLGAIDNIEKRISVNDEKMDAFKAEIEKRNPTSIEKMSLRTQKSGPFTQTPEEYWEKDAPENYSPEDDNDGVGQEQYEITKGDIDNFNDWTGIAKSLDDERERMGLKGILGY